MTVKLVVPQSRILHFIQGPSATCRGRVESRGFVERARLNIHMRAACRTSRHLPEEALGAIPSPCAVACFTLRLRELEKGLRELRGWAGRRDYLAGHDRLKVMSRMKIHVTSV
jgi:hypothetical protein